MTIKITNLTQDQVDMLDHMWNLETLEQYQDWYNDLEAEDQHMADSLQRLLLLEVADQLVTDTTEACEYLERFRLQ